MPGVARHPLAREADTYQALADGEDDAAVHVVPGVPLVLLHDRELHAVDQQQFVQRQPQGLGHQHVDLHQRHAAGVVGPQSAVALPGGCEAGEESCADGGRGRLQRWRVKLEAKAWTRGGRSGW